MHMKNYSERQQQLHRGFVSTRLRLTGKAHRKREFLMRMTNLSIDGNQALVVRFVWLYFNPIARGIGKRHLVAAYRAVKRSRIDGKRPETSTMTPLVTILYGCPISSNLLQPISRRLHFCVVSKLMIQEMPSDVVASSLASSLLIAGQ